MRWSVRLGGTMRHPKDMGAVEVEAFLTMLVTERRVSSSTHNQAISALLFLYKNVLGRWSAPPHYKRTGIPRSAIRAFAWATVYSP